jgi:peptide/nickel transport system permease protein
MVPTLLGISVLCFALLHLAPGDPALVRANTGSPSGDATALLERFRREHLLDRPLAVQYLHYLGPFDLGPDGHRWFGGDGSRPWNGLLAGDLGHEYLRPSVSVASELRRRLAVSVPLSGTAILLCFLIAVPLGIHGALRRGTPLELAGTALGFALYALPVFVAARLLQLAFGVSGLGWLPVLGLASADAAELSAPERVLDAVRHAILPIACLTYGGVAYVSRQMRAGMLDALAAEHVRAARAKGLPERAVLRRHVLRNALLPLVALVGHLLPMMVGGSIVVETVFDVPGMGLYAYESLLSREYDAVLGCVLCSALMTLAGFLLSDVLLAAVDPRVRL